MKKLVIVLGVITISIVKVQAQNNSEAVQLAHKIAKKMKDSLDLSAQQRQQIYGINMQLHNQKQAVRQQYSGNDSLLTVNIRAVERQRDSLYRPVIGEEKYLRYQQKKRNIVNNN